MSASRKCSVSELFTSKGLHLLAKKFGHKWKGVLIMLGSEDAEIDRLEQDHAQAIDRIRNGFRMWNDKNKKAEVAKRVDDLIDALQMEGLQNVIEYITDTYDLEEVKSAKSIEEEPRKDEKENERANDVTLSDKETCEYDVGSKHIPPMRDYQLEIAQPGINGKNSIIWAGTGSGKTRVALHVMQRHLDSNPEGRIVYFANTIPLLNQQYTAAWRYLLSYQGQILKCSGDDPTSNEFHSVFQRYRVCVVTPMILQHCLDNKSVELSAFTMLVFDECHHTRKGETYNKIMSHYRKLKYRGDCCRLPQIVGLTASFGTEKARNLEEAEESAYRLMARLDAKIIATPQIHKEEYKKHVPDPTQHSERMVDRPVDPFGKIIQDAMEKIEGMLRSETNCDNEIAKQMQILPVKCRSESQYQSWLSSFERDIKLSKSLTDDMKYSLAVAKNHLQVYHDALKVNKILCMQDVLEQLNRSSLKYNLLQDQSQDLRRKMVDIYKDMKENLKLLKQDPKNENPSIVRLGDMVDEIFQNMGKDSTCIIYIETREAAIATKRFIQRECQNAKCCFLIGSKIVSEDKDAQSQVEQQKAVQDFRNGICNVLLTTFAEEGLDMPACNAVIKYNTSGNDISVTQTAGRIRQNSGKVIYFGENQKQLREALSFERVKLMNSALERILGHTSISITDRVETLQKQITKEEEQAERVMAMQKAKKTKERFELICGRCQTPAVGSNGIRCYKDTQYIVLDKEFYEKVRRRRDKKRAKFYMAHIDRQHSIECKKCGSYWAAGVKINNIFCAVLKAASYIFIDHDTNDKYPNPRSWSNLPFKVTSMTIDDLKSLSDVDETIEDVACDDSVE